MRPKDYGFKTVKTGNKSHKPGSPLMSYIAKEYGLAHGYKGELGGWIYDSKGQHIAHGWTMFFYAMKGQVRAWAIQQGLIKEDMQL